MSHNPRYRNDEDEAWKESAACRGTKNPDVFYPNIGEPTSKAIRICHRCPVEAECLNYALRHREMYGVWGGKSQNERRIMLRALGSQVYYTDLLKSYGGEDGSGSPTIGGPGLDDSSVSHTTEGDESRSPSSVVQLRPEAQEGTGIGPVNC